MRASIRLNEPLNRHTAWRTGGACDAFVVAHDVSALAKVIADCRASRWKCSVLGAATRTVVRDGGVQGVVVRLGADFNRIERFGNRWSVGAAVPVPALVAATADAGFSGLESLSHIPGSVGGLLAVEWPNRQLSASVYRVEVLRKGRGHELEPEKYVPTKSNVVTRAVFELTPCEPSVVRKRILKHLRGALTDAGRSSSSWYSGLERAKFQRTIERQNLHGARLRGAIVPSSSPELLVNLGGGTARDLALLHRSILARMRKEHDPKLSSTIRWMGMNEVTNDQS